MSRILLSGCCGYMGRVVNQLIKQNGENVVVAGVDKQITDQADFPVYSDFTQVNEPVDAVIDFSHPSCLSSLLSYCKEHKVPAVIATTGMTCEQMDEIARASEEVPLFFSGNMSLGINLMAALVKQTAAFLGSSMDIEIIEAHHNRKIDAPSGTAKMLLEAATEGCNRNMMPVYDRHDRRQKREPNEIGIHSLRGGTIVGEHSVMFSGEDEIVTISHSARSRDIFAAGAVKAAGFLIGKTPGLYDMSDLIAEIR